MPWKSEAQRKYMWATNPEIAEEWEKHTTKKERDTLPNYTKKRMQKEAGEMFVTFLNEAAKEAFDATDIDLDFSTEDTAIIKYAGTLITDLSPEGIESFIKYFMSNELSFFPEKVDIRVEIYPMEGSYATPGGAVLENATGNIHLVYGNADVIIPFMIRDRGLLPFDIIQIGKERAVYTRMNLKKVLFGIQAQLQNNKLNDPLNPYKGVDKHINQLTDYGFMHDVLKVQELASHYPVANTTSESIASEAVDSLLEKVSSLAPIKLNYEMAKFQLREKYRKTPEKIAELEASEEEKLASAGAMATKFINVHHIPSNSNIIIPDKDGSIIMNLKAKVYKELISSKKLMFDRVLMITIDNRFVDLRNNERMLAQIDDADWDFKTASITGVKPGYLYTGLIGNACMVPFTINTVTLGSKYLINMRYAYECTDIDGNKFMIAQGNMPPKTIMFMSKDKAIGEALRNDTPDKQKYYEIIFKDGVPIMFLPENTEFIELRGAYTHRVTNLRELTITGFSDFDNEYIKTASYGDGVRVSIFSREDLHTFNIDVRWTNREHTPYIDARIPFSKVGEGKARGILRTLGLTFEEISEIITKAQREGTAFLPIREHFTPHLLRSEAGGIVQSEGVIDNLRKAFFNRDNAIDAGAALVGGTVGTLMAGKAIANYGKALSSFADESKALALKMEKIAYKHKSPFAAKVAKMMLIKSNLDNMVKKALDGSEFKIDFDLNDLEVELSKTASELVYVKVRQYADRNEMISPNVLQASINHLDGLYKYCKVFSNETR